SMLISQERAGEPPNNLLGYLEQCHLWPGTRGTLNLELVAVEAVQIHQRPNDEHIDRHPDGTAAVGIASEHAGIRFGGQVLYFVFLRTAIKNERRLEVRARAQTK